MCHRHSTRLKLNDGFLETVIAIRKDAVIYVTYKWNYLANICHSISFSFNAVEPPSSINTHFVFPLFPSSLINLRFWSMGRAPCCDKKGLKKGPWTAEEDQLLVSHIEKHGCGSWRSLPRQAGLLRCGKSCRLRWTNYLRPDIKRGPFTAEEEKLVIQLHGILGNKWAAIASQLAGRTDNEIKNLWNTHLKKRLLSMGVDPLNHQPLACGAKTTVAAASPTSGKLEAEGRVSIESLPQEKSQDYKSGSDFFLRMWNSEVGESFRSFYGGKSFNGGELSQASSSTKCCSPSPVPGGTGSSCVTATSTTCGGELAIDSSISTEGSSEDTALQLLLDFPMNNDMSFLESSSLSSYVSSTSLFNGASLLCS